MKRIKKIILIGLVIATIVLCGSSMVSAGTTKFGLFLEYPSEYNHDTGVLAGTTTGINFTLHWNIWPGGFSW